MHSTIVLAVIALLVSSPAFAEPVRYQFRVGGTWTGISGYEELGIVPTVEDVLSYGGYFRFTVPAFPVGPASMVVPDGYFRVKADDGTILTASGPVHLWFESHPTDGNSFGAQFMDPDGPGYGFSANTTFDNFTDAMLNVDVDEYWDDPAAPTKYGFYKSAYWIGDEVTFASDGADRVYGPITAMPEPTSLVLSSLGLVALGAARQWRS